MRFTTMVSEYPGADIFKVIGPPEIGKCHFPVESVIVLTPPADTRVTVASEIAGPAT